MHRTKIVASHIYPPIPVRCFDWTAYIDGREEEGPYGFGETKEKAIADLILQMEEESEPETERASLEAEGVSINPQGEVLMEALRGSLEGEKT